MPNQNCQHPEDQVEPRDEMEGDRVVDTYLYCNVCESEVEPEEVTPMDELDQED